MNTKNGAGEGEGASKGEGASVRETVEAAAIAAADAAEVVELTPEQLNEIIQQRFQGFVADAMGALTLFAPHLQPQEALSLAQHVAGEQLSTTGVPSIVESMVDPDAVAKHPTIVLKITDDKNGIVMKAPKRLERVNDLSGAAQSAVLLAFMLSPSARAVLRAFGFKYQFAASREPATGQIVLSS